MCAYSPVVCILTEFSIGDFFPLKSNLNCWKAYHFSN
ncbi:hypothetical protein T03_5641 [Trichinella britovi]|uniref:Uncharacterized protein n=1 Tax=Trichinella britovi TaxID=45882 RepID=A0A0V0Z2H7_TRIBR|nr:hypothetical protein T03_5641 [Trichinella britovi]